ncbi:MAG: type II secretion system protein [Planctomycetes bacterium]|nr:type II secretion system protein [Planctomycetota bacterium]
MRHPLDRFRPPPAAARVGFTLIELLVVISIIAVLAGMLLPAIGFVREIANRARCGSNQHQIVLAMITYVSDNSQMWPVRPALADGTPDPAASPTQPLYTTISSFEFLSSSLGRDLPPAIFACPSIAVYRPPAPAVANLDFGTPGVASTWCAAVAAGANDPQTPGYCYDWSIPSQPTAMRVVTADRARESKGHRNKVVCCFADGHTAMTSQTIVPLVGGTANIDSTAGAWQFVNPDCENESIFDGVGDDGDMTSVATGSSTRAWVR